MVGQFEGQRLEVALRGMALLFGAGQFGAPVRPLLGAAQRRYQPGGRTRPKGAG